MQNNIFFVSLGCDKNTVDGEIMLELLLSHGYTLVKAEEEADIIVINTCAFIRDAMEEAINTIIEMGRYKTEGKCKALVVTGCLAQRFSKEIFEEMPEVDAVVGTGSYEKIVEAVDEVMAGKEQVSVVEDINTRDLGYYKRYLTTVGYYSYLKIAEGCDNHCTYCIIPSLRGRYRSRLPYDIMREVRDLAEQGVAELMIVAQDITKYGRDLGNGSYRLADLLHDICKVDGLRWIRLLYCYPEDLDDELIECIKTEPKILHYLDIPIQHASDSVLHRMCRLNTEASLRELMAKLRREIPDICLRTTLITGFPGETEEEFEVLRDFVNEVRFDRLGVFAYSKEDGTPAARMKGQIPAKIKEKRKAEIMELQRGISDERSAALVGRKLTALIEGVLPEKSEEGYTYIARTYRDAPEIDGFIFINSWEELRSGDFVDCEVIGSFEYDLIGKLIK